MISSWLDAVDYSLCGGFIGVLIGLTGVGGASLMTPLLVLLFGVHPATAVGTDLLYAAITKSAGSVVHSRHGNINWRIVGLLAAGSLPASLLTLWLVSSVDRSDLALIGGITVALGALLILTAILLLARPWLKKLVAPRLRAFGGERHEKRILVLTWVLGLILGTLVTITSVGAGAIGVTILLLLYPRLPIHEVVGSDIAHAIPLTFVAGIGYWMIGEIDWMILGTLLTGSIPGIIAGSHLAPRLPEVYVRTLLAITLLIVGGKLIL
jgi:uncharacterized protein